MDLLALLRVRLVFTRPTSFHFFHHAALYAALLERLGTPRDFPPGVAIYTPERARVRYAEGEPYHFGVAFTPTSALAPQEFVQALRLLPRTGLGWARTAPFSDNYRIESVTDLVADAPLVGRPRLLTSADLALLAEKLAAEREITIRFISPLLILRTPINTREFIMDGDVFEPAKFLERVKQAVESSWPGAEFTHGLDVVPKVTLLENRMLRTDLAYPKKRLLGSSGSVRLRFEDGVGAWALPLLLAGILGVGKAYNMGQGRFVVEDHPLPIAWPPKPARTLLERASDPVNLEAARTELAHAGAAPGVDEIAKQEFLDSLTHDLPGLADALLRGNVEPTPLRGILIRERKPDTGREKLRPLAIPSFRDRFLQRAVLSELGDTVEQLLEDASFAYRKGLSYRNAQRGVLEAQKDGFKFALDADIHSFFDEVDWERLRTHLAAYFDDDPIVDVLMQWVRTPVTFEGQRIERSRGLPQGAVVSPLLANFYLDALDEAIAAQGFRLVRYADDFVVLCKTEAETKRAHQVVTEELKKLGLALNEAKTKETSFEEGFTFLGALFCRSLVLDADKHKKEVLAVLEKMPQPLDPKAEAIDIGGWLSDFLAHRGEREEGAETPTEQIRWRAPVLPPSPERSPVYVVSKGASLSGRKRGLFIEQDGQPPQMVAWEKISELVVLGGRYISSSVISRAMTARIPVAFHKWDGTPVGLVLPDRVRSPSPVTLLQWEWKRDEGKSLEIARSLIVAKLRNQRLFLHRRKEPGALSADLKRSMDEASRATSVDSLRGIEGQAAHLYFARWPGWLTPEIGGYPGRISRGASDPVNVMLNLLYTQLFRLTHTTILSTGLDPYLGVLHDGKGRYAALAADFMEPFRFLVDRIVLESVNHGSVQACDFIHNEKGFYKLMLKAEAVKNLIAAYEELFAREVADEGGRQDSFRGHLYRQAMSLRRVIEGKEQAFTAFQMKW